MTRYGLVVVFAWIGAMKFSAYEATGIQPLVANSPLMSWLYNIFSVQAFSNWLGVLEIAIAVMIAAKPISARISAAGTRWPRCCSWAPSASSYPHRLCGRQAQPDFPLCRSHRDNSY